MERKTNDGRDGTKQALMALFSLWSLEVLVVKET